MIKALHASFSTYPKNIANEASETFVKARRKGVASIRIDFLFVISKRLTSLNYYGSFYLMFTWKPRTNRPAVLVSFIINA